MKDSIKFGVITGLFFGTFLIIHDYIKLHNIFHIKPDVYDTFGTMGYFIYGLGLYFGITNKRDVINGGHITYSQASTEGFKISLVVTLVFVITSLVNRTLIIPDYTELSIRQTVEILQAQKKSTAEINSAITELKNETDLTTQLISSLIFTFISGAFLSLILSVFIRNKNVQDS